MADDTAPAADAATPQPPLLRVVRGNPSPEELAALVAVIAARSGGAGGPEAPTRSAWTDRSRLVRQPLRPGPGAWKASALPR